MTRICAAIITAIGVSIGAPASADNVSDIGKLLTSAPLICGTFTQSKTLAALTRPLVSSGRVVFAAGTGVLWQISSPFPSRALVKEDALIRWDSENKPKRSGFGQTPQYRALSDVFFAVFAGDTSRLAASFETETKIAAESWSLGLKPRDGEFATRISNIYVSGRRFVESLKITEAQGDRTEIQFKNLTADGCVLSSAETRSFAQ